MNIGDFTVLIMVLVGIVCFLIGVLAIMLYQRSKGGKIIQNETEDYKKQQDEKRKKEQAEAQNMKLRDFMEFDKVEDDMIIQDDGARYVMAIRCMGINYDLMSEPEMLAVEEGFANFLNTLKIPIQLYVQARSLDLSEGLRLYHNRLDELKKDYDKYVDAVNRAKATSANLTSMQKQQMDYEIKKKRALLDYGTDIVSHIEKMNLNRSVLQRKYYIIVSYEPAEMGITNTFSKEEAKDVAYADLYTRCKTIQAALAPCGIESSILKSEELAELLYIAYNKDDADMFDVKRAIEGGFTRLYSTAPSVMEKKREALDAKIKEDAIAQAELALKTAMDGLRSSSSVDISSLTEQEQYEDDTKKEAMQIILDNQEQFDPEVVDKALEDLNSSMHKPLVSQEELDEVENEDGNMVYNGAESGAVSGIPVGMNTGSANPFDNTNEINNILNGDPLDDYLNKR